MHVKHVHGNMEGKENMNEHSKNLHWLRIESCHNLKVGARLLNAAFH